MSEADEQVELLTREELDAILSEVAEGRSDRAPTLAGPFRRPARRRAVRPVRLPQLRAGVQAGLSTWGKQLASHHQRRISCELFGWEEVEVAELLESLLPTDRLALFETEPQGARGFVLIARPLAFGLLSCEFGGRRCAASPPERSFTRIEERFLRRTAEEVLGHLQRGWSDSFPVSSRILSLSHPGELADQTPATLMLASAELSGISSVGRLRVGLPKTSFVPAETAPAPVPRQEPNLRRALGDVDVPLQVEIGSTQLSLGQLGSLAAGDELMLTPSSPGGFLVRIGGMPKFHATRGSVAGRLAVQVQNRIRKTGGRGSHE